MKIKNIWLSAIRTLNTPDDAVSSGDFWDYMRVLWRNEPVSLGQINIFIGENGSGKSTVIDMVRALRYPEVLASLPRENPPRQILPSASVEFDNGERWSYIFSASTFDDTLDGIEDVACRQVVESPFQPLRQRSGDLHKHALCSPLPRFITHENIHYRNGMTLEESFTEAAVAELNRSKPFLCNLDIERQGPFGHKPLDDGTFQLGEDGRLSVWIKDDPLMPNQLPASWLPSGWKAYALMAAWLRECPEHSICLLEEPETHLHPKMLRFVIDSLIAIAEERNQQLLLSTHSATVINVAAKDRLTLFQTCGSHIKSKPDLRDILDRLGYLASDILQANCILWVEGPSDRIYLNHWIKGHTPDLVEGLHYSIMFYGGRLLSHLAADEQEDGADDFIDLQSLNRNSAILIDSDRSSAQGVLRQSKVRVMKEIEASGGVAWVTKGREIENYIAPAHIEAVIRNHHRHVDSIVSPSIWANPLEYKTLRRVAKKVPGKTSKVTPPKRLVANKVKVAAKITSQYAPDYTVLDLAERIEALCRFIRKCN
ncbi:ATP-dependent nuclease [Pseudomonas bananamidigenes]|uniref:ATP-dependent nuclease n=1 Tax=Pseudomonas bananamidigenes TaxID=2843610 RepID=UPI0008036FF4|nr:ATP-binding protein [Pseudomonas bananamidigenes]